MTPAGQLDQAALSAGNPPWSVLICSATICGMSTPQDATRTASSKAPRYRLGGMRQAYHGAEARIRLMGDENATQSGWHSAGLLSALAGHQASPGSLKVGLSSA